MKNKIRRWTQSELDILYREYPDKYTKELAKLLNRKIESINQKAHSIGLKKSDEFHRQDKIKLSKYGSLYRFGVGFTPHNKGKKMSIELYEKVKKTMFKKGIVPHNAKYDGHEVLSKDGYVMVRIRLGKYELKHRVIWEAVNGPVPAGHCIRFIDGNKNNFDVNNLKCISRVENMSTNQVHKYPQEIKDLIKLKNKLKTKINEKQNR